MPREDFDSPILVELRKNFDYSALMWKDIYDEGRRDMNYVAGDPWEEKERKARKDAGRLCLTFDLLNQYCNQLINDVRQNQRSVKVVPRGFGASDFTAQSRAGMIREIEYKSKAQAAIRTAFEGAVNRSFGFYKFKTAYVRDSASEQELLYVRIPNPETIYIDWDAKEADCSDMEYAFEFDTLPVWQFKERFPGAEVQSFTPELAQAYPAWIKGERIQIASYWKRHHDKDVLLEFENGTRDRLSKMEGAKLGANFVTLPDGTIANTRTQRKEDKITVCQHVTNGIEELDQHEWPDDEIPIIPVLGKELWVDGGAGAERRLLSLVRLARDPFMAYCYTRTGQMELVQQTPKAPYEGYVGQFATRSDFQNAHKVPTAYLEFKATTDESIAANGGVQSPILPLPRRAVFDASGVQALEITAQSCEKAVQSAMGITGLLNGTATRGDAFSGKALRELDAQQSQGNFHFIDNLDIALENGGRKLNRLLKPVYDSTRDAGFRKASGEHYTSKINVVDEQGQPVMQDQQGQPIFHTDVGEHEVQITTGPSDLSQRQEVSSFIDSLSNDPAIWPLVADLAIKLKNLGPYGEEMAKRVHDHFNPPNQGPQIPPAVQQQLQQLTALVQKLTFEKQAKIMELQGKMQLEQQKQAGDNWKVTQQQSVDLEKTRMNNEAMIQQALVKLGQATQADQVAAQLQQLITLWEQQHEFGMAAGQAAHEQAMAEQEHQRQLEQIAAQPQPPAAPPSPGPQA